MRLLHPEMGSLKKIEDGEDDGRCIGKC